MERQVGIWIDQARAIICTLEGGTMTLEELESGVEARVRSGGGARTGGPYGAQDVTSEGRNLERHRAQLRKFYRHVLEAVADADALYLMGPGLARQGLEQAIRERLGLGSRLRGSDRCDRLTPNQVAARVREFFGRPLQRGRRKPHPAPSAA